MTAHSEHLTPEIVRLVGIARREVGYHEGRAAGHWDNQEKYARQVAGLGWANGQPWCAVFVAWCALEAQLNTFYPASASCDVDRAWFRSRGQLHDYPAIGAQVFYGTPSVSTHTGLVVEYDHDSITCVEGNSNDSGSVEGDGVYLQHRPRRADFVLDYGYPDVPGGLVAADPAYRRPAAPPAAPRPESRGRQVDVMIHAARKAIHNNHPHKAEIQRVLAALLDLPPVQGKGKP